ncbi:hypothetical protein [Aquimarina rubra]|uniref:DUF4375 domain-containing protein n=1 Tax=Aquimarina rubra TaxID=1920033 RepID=A0ABW5LI41_9FLAO
MSNVEKLTKTMENQDKIIENIVEIHKSDVSLEEMEYFIKYIHIGPSKNYGAYNFCQSLSDYHEYFGKAGFNFSEEKIEQVFQHLMFRYPDKIYKTNDGFKVLNEFKPNLNFESVIFKTINYYKSKM